MEISEFIASCNVKFGSKDVSVPVIRAYAIECGIKPPWKDIKVFNVGGTRYNFAGLETPRVNKFELPDADDCVQVPEHILQRESLLNKNPLLNVCSMTDSEVSFVPETDPSYVPYGIATDLYKIIKTDRFIPVYVTGETGIGKTLAIVQACAKAKRELIRFNVTVETEESDLFGDFRLNEGNMTFHKGPVLEAMERGAVLLLDELSAGNPNKLLALQSVLEGKGAFIKKICQRFDHKKGFTVIATDNSKGKGSESGRFIGLNVQNEAFLDRFSVTMVHTYPNVKEETRILNAFCKAQNVEPNVTFIDTLVKWADIIRKTFEADGCSEVISTRRLVSVYQLFLVFGEQKKAIEYSINRFDNEVISSFTSLFDKLTVEEVTVEDNGDQRKEMPYKEIFVGDEI